MTARATVRAVHMTEVLSISGHFPRDKDSGKISTISPPPPYRLDPSFGCTDTDRVAGMFPQFQRPSVLPWLLIGFDQPTPVISLRGPNSVLGDPPWRLEGLYYRLP